MKMDWLKLGDAIVQGVDLATNLQIKQALGRMKGGSKDEAEPTSEEEKKQKERREQGKARLTRAISHAKTRKAELVAKFKIPDGETDISIVEAFLNKHNIETGSEFSGEDAENAIMDAIGCHDESVDLDGLARNLMLTNKVTVLDDPEHLATLVRISTERPQLRQFLDVIARSAKKAKEVWELVKQSNEVVELLDNVLEYFHREELAEAKYRKLVGDLSTAKRGVIDGWMGSLDPKIQTHLRQSIGFETEQQAIAFLRDVIACENGEGRTALAKARGLCPAESVGRNAFRARTAEIAQETERKRKEFTAAQEAYQQLKGLARVRRWLSGR